MSKSLQIEVGIYARDGVVLDSELAERAGVPRREARLKRQYVFEIRKPSGAVLDADGEFWQTFGEQIIDTLSEAIIQRAIDDADLPLPTQYMAFWPALGEGAASHGRIDNQYFIKCVECNNGMSEMGVRGLCSDCSE